MHPPASPRKTGRSPATAKDVNVNWESLQEDLIRLVAARLLAGDFFDYVRFRAVCKVWRSATVSPRGRGVVDPCFHPRRWMMFPEGRDLYPGHPELGDHVRFFNLDSGAFVRVRLPLFKNFCVLESVHGLLLLQRDQDTAICLLHPFTGDIVGLPPLATLATQMPGHRPWSLARVRRLCASVSFPAGGGGAATVLLAFHDFLGAAVATSGLDERWTMLPWTAPIPYVHGQVSLQGKMYAVRVHDFCMVGAPKIFEMDARLHRDPPKVIFTCPTTESLYRCCLVERGSEILVVSHDCPDLSRMSVYRLADLVLGNFVRVTDIGENAIFTGERNLCVSSKVFPTVMANTIVGFRPKEGYFARYNIGTNTWSEAMDKCSLDGTRQNDQFSTVVQGGPPEQGPCSLISHLFNMLLSPVLEQRKNVLSVCVPSCLSGR